MGGGTSPSLFPALYLMQHACPDPEFPPFHSAPRLRRSQVALGAFGGRPRLSGWMCGSTPVYEGILEGSKRLRSKISKIGRIELGWLETSPSSSLPGRVLCKARAAPPWARHRRNPRQPPRAFGGRSSSVWLVLGDIPIAGEKGPANQERSRMRSPDGGTVGLDEPPPWTPLMIDSVCCKARA